jgi:hypothetical protein
MNVDKFKELNEKIKEHLCICLSNPALTSERILSVLYFMRDDSMQSYMNKYNYRGHTNSFFYECVNGSYTEQDVEDYFKDIEHGFLHGFCVSFWGFLLKSTEFEQSNNLNRETYEIDESNYTVKLMSCLLHDFLRTSSSGHLGGHHDQELRKVIPKLCQETYSHSDGEADHEVIVGDKIELMRYSPDGWIDYSTLPDHDEEMVKLFYQNIRPALEYYTIHQDDVWLYHWFDTGVNRDRSWDFDGDFECPQNPYTGRNWSVSFFRGGHLSTLYPPTHQDWKNMDDRQLDVPLTCMTLKKRTTSASNWYTDYIHIRDREHYIVEEPGKASDFILGYNSHYDFDISKIIDGGHKIVESNVVLVYALFLDVMKTVMRIHARPN